MREETINLYTRIETLEKALRHIQGMCGHLDAKEACRLIIKRAEQALVKRQNDPWVLERDE